MCVRRLKKGVEAEYEKEAIKRITITNRRQRGGREK